MVSPTEVLVRLKTLGVKAEVRDGKLITRRPPDITIPPDLAEAIRAHKAEIIRLLSGPSALVCPACGADDLHPDDVARFGDCVQCGAPILQTPEEIRVGTRT